VEQFGYGFGFAAFLIYLIYLADGPAKTAHYALATGFMALGMMLPGMISGYVQEALGYSGFFVWVVLASIPAFLLLFKIQYPPTYGQKAAIDE
jgi:PAT family beta-lactamase induction signal transducer AmpG